MSEKSGLLWEIELELGEERWRIAKSLEDKGNAGSLDSVVT